MSEARARGTLFVVSTPIGNLQDITLRAIETLRSCDLLLAEDTRRTRHLLTHLGIEGKRVERFDAHAAENDVSRTLAVLAAGRQVALVTDAGTPVVSDPGSALVRAAIDAGVRVTPIPGPSAPLAALVASGLAADGRFRFFGFLPREGSARRGAIAEVSDTAEPVVLFEAANRCSETLRELSEATPSREACVARELTKVHEELARGTVRALADDPREWVGEVCIVLGPHAPEERAIRIDDEALDARIDEALGRAEHPRSIAEKLAAWSGRPKRDIYARVVARKGSARTKAFR